MRALAVVALTICACTEKNPDFCASDEDCAGTPMPFCDVNGEFPESNGSNHICIPTPADCPVERCGCVAGTALACDLDELVVCGEDGTSTVTSTCPLGCSTEDRCLVFEPSNGLGPALEMAAGASEVVLPAGTTIDTETGAVLDANGVPIDVTSIVVSQAGAPSIRAFVGASFAISDLKATGAFALAFVATGPITIDGVVDVSADGIVAGPGGREPPAACVGASSTTCTNQPCISSGGGGGGGMTVGGAGGGNNQPGAAGGAAVDVFVPLVGGCRGGMLGTTILGGGGGGAIQLVSLTMVDFLASSLLHLGGGGGAPGTGGGGSGGVAILEAPRVRFAVMTGIVANGGSGGGCAVNGANGPTNTSVAIAPNCSVQIQPGNGGSQLTPPEAGATACTGACLVPNAAGGGGGAAGRALISTATGTFEALSPTFSVGLATSTLVPQ